MKPAVAWALAVVLAAAGVAGGYWFGMSQGIKHVAPATPGAGAAPKADDGRKVLYWYDPMYPQQRFDKPGKSPFMDMQLVPKYADESAGEGGVAINPRVAQNLGVRTAAVRTGTLGRKVEAVGTVAWNERGVVVLQSRTAGFVEKLHARAPLDPVAKGAPLVELLVPEWAAAQEEYLALLKSELSGTETLRAASRQRLLLLGMSEELIQSVEHDRRVQPRFTLRAPIGGVIAELDVREGMTVMSGATLFRIVDLSTVWVNAEVPESLSAAVRPGTPVEARVAAFPGETFRGRVAAILPELNVETRTVRARIELANPRARLAPGMFASLSFAPSAARPTLLVPSEAVIRTGTRTVVVLADEKGMFRPVDVEAGGESGGDTEIVKGLSAGDRVVLSGQFLIDSEASLRATLTRMQPSESAGAAAAPVHRAEGVMVSGDDSFLTIKHGAIPSAGMGAMTMEFKSPQGGLPAGLKAGDPIRFEFVITREGDYHTTKVEPAGRSGKAPEPQAGHGDHK
ncbi:MAG TPA: efflux RND transporter periplasmic adaptor subunit [Burkholderiales bacterium]|nr:efflux RND transporter periplasmic adaptor subunit [Burkholderiales bacterium]